MQTGALDMHTDTFSGIVMVLYCVPRGESINNSNSYCLTVNRLRRAIHTRQRQEEYGC